MTCSRCSGVLLSRRGNHARGTPRTRPSLRSTQKLSSSKRTRVGLTEQFIPFPLDEAPVCVDDLDQQIRCSCVVSPIVGHLHLWVKPKLGFQARFEGMDVQ